VAMTKMEKPPRLPPAAPDLLKRQEGVAAAGFEPATSRL
jgi:hypothetical protein